jgi:hypothetical protein
MNGNQITQGFIVELKLSILAMASTLKNDRDPAGVCVLNNACRELLGVSGEVFSCGMFVKVA